MFSGSDVHHHGICALQPQCTNGKMHQPHKTGVSPDEIPRFQFATPGDQAGMPGEKGLI